MKLRIIPIAAAAACALTCGTASAQVDYSSWGVKAGIFMPTSSELRKVFGDNWFSFGLTPQQSNTAEKDVTFGFDIGLILANSGGSNLTLIPLTAGYTMVFTDRSNAVVPYGAIRAGVAYYNYSITPPGGSQALSDSTINITGNAELGVIFSQKFTLAARYNWFAESNHFDFDGLTLWAELQLFRF